ncbi:hypothetical protein IA539_17405 [Gordonia sp. zg691]|uniref:Uncharacterized protein n=1 Tax=Gordonia jinghuaiqii TaxID=2758710 RepID=A0A7D7R075_9ACTN|nr:hypothetical protein [Gordonia jinghuaiqii]MBD0862963.1 hypothetical protein [Gordonia jinghuaiqii]MCR5978910.1 hypothetical protein [Gordonia jinghuaiqii]QMT01751.1 hypothetical protein H1R19_00610 [Gordonia jinghuaiqii]
MKLADTLHSPRRGTLLTSLTGGRIGGRREHSTRFPAEAERLITPAELRRFGLSAWAEARVPR